MLATLLPLRCPLCRRAGSVPCAACAAALTPAPPGPVPAVLAYEGAGRALLAALKFRGARPVARSLAPAMAGLVVGTGPHLVTWAPTAPARARRRGFDQAQLLAEAVARELGVPCAGLLRRSPATVPQTGRHRRERLGDPPRFTARRAVDGVVDSVVVVVDDVVTTGATMRSAASCLLAAGARRVVPVAAAATPPSGRCATAEGHHRGARSGLFTSAPSGLP